MEPTFEELKARFAELQERQRKAEEQKAHAAKTENQNTVRKIEPSAPAPAANLRKIQEVHDSFVWLGLIVAAIFGFAGMVVGETDSKAAIPLFSIAAVAFMVACIGIHD